MVTNRNVTVREFSSAWVPIVVSMVSACGGSVAASADGGAGADAATDTSSMTDAPGGAGGMGGGADAGTHDGDGGGMSADATSDGATTCAVCPSYASAVPSGRVTASNLSNLSGMAVSSRNPGVLYVHNDMTRQEVFALSESGALLATYGWTGVTVADMEDMAVARCPAGSCIYLADIGGNLAARTTFAILRMPEPTVAAGQAPVTASVTVERLTFSYADGMHNAESLLVDPASDALYIITKVDSGPSAVYRLTGAFGQTGAVAQKVADLPVPKTSDRPATSASAHPCGAGFLLRTSNTLYEFRIAPGARFESAFQVPPVTVPVASETQGEAVAYRADGRGYFTTGEGAMPALNRADCAATAAFAP
jgi:hypothetical protein